MNNNILVHTCVIWYNLHFFQNKGNQLSNFGPTAYTSMQDTWLFQ